MVTLQLMMFLLVGIGFLIRKKGIIGGSTRKELVDFCLYVTLPFNIFHSFQMEWEQGMLTELAEVLLLSAGYNLISIAVSFLCYRKITSDRQKPLRYGTIVSNGGFLGNPVVEGVYGTQGLFYASVFMLPVRIVMWSVGTSCFLKDKVNPGNVAKKVLTHPCIVSIYLGLAVMISGLKFPAFLDNTISGVSACNTPLSMMLVGMMLAEMNPRGIFDKTMLSYTFIRLAVIPAVIFALTVWMPIPPILRGTGVIIAGMPAPVTTALLSSKYGGDETYATGMIFFSTVMSLFTLPLWCLVLK